MPLTRSASRAAAAAVASLHIAEDAAPPAPEMPQKSRPTKRKAASSGAKKATRKKSRTEDQIEQEPAPAAKEAVVKTIPRDDTPPVLVPAQLTFSFEDAKAHLIEADARFEDLFDRLKCRPFEHLERVDPFRLFDPSLPEKPTEHGLVNVFPDASAYTLTEMILAKQTSSRLPIRLRPWIYRLYGLPDSVREKRNMVSLPSAVVLDLAARFADGRLSTEKLLEADDETLYEILTAVRGIGRWTVDMFAIFSLRRPDILPVGDLGVQRGVLRWFLSRHAPSFAITISPKKLPKPPTDEQDEPSSNALEKDETDVQTAVPEDASVIPPIPKAPVTPAPKTNGKRKAKARKDDGDEDNSDNDADVLPTPFTPSINKVLNAQSGSPSDLPPLPQGLTVATLKSRLNSKNKVKGAILTPQEMTELTEPWKPYRSLGRLGLINK
ncbi:hypothetical protein EIP86_004951 [Pleurotus ostreatoroseus]|nr:hypothetical protein EIP86_004951 [Pleurotus ostreatoroseus]